MLLRVPGRRYRGRMTDATADPTPPAPPVTASGRPPRRSATPGVWALAVTLFPLLYTVVGLILLAFGQGANGIGGFAEAAYVMFFLGFLVVPACLIVGLVLGIIALAFSRPLGKVLGGIALVLIVAGVVALTLLLMGSNSPLFWTDF